MELYKEILVNVLAKEDLHPYFPSLSDSIAQVMEKECYKALEKIQLILDDDSLADAECFQKIEESVCVFEELGSSGGSRHDFG